MDEIVSMNVDKLEKRYPGGEFDPWYSEHRVEGDLWTLTRDVIWLKP